MKDIVFYEIEDAKASNGPAAAAAAELASPYAALELLDPSFSAFNADYAEALSQLQAMIDELKALNSLADSDMQAFKERLDQTQERLDATVNFVSTIAEQEQTVIELQKSVAQSLGADVANANYQEIQAAFESKLAEQLDVPPHELELMTTKAAFAQAAAVLENAVDAKIASKIAAASASVQEAASQAIEAKAAAVVAKKQAKAAAKEAKMLAKAAELEKDTSAEAQAAAAIYKQKAKEAAEAKQAAKTAEKALKEQIKKELKAVEAEQKQATKAAKEAVKEAKKAGASKEQIKALKEAAKEQKAAEKQAIKEAKEAAKQAEKAAEQAMKEAVQKAKEAMEKGQTAEEAAKEAAATLPEDKELTQIKDAAKEESKAPAVDDEPVAPAPQTFEKAYGSVKVIFATKAAYDKFADGKVDETAELNAIKALQLSELGDNKIQKINGFEVQSADENGVSVKGSAISMGFEADATVTNLLAVSTAGVAADALITTNKLSALGGHKVELDGGIKLTLDTNVTVTFAPKAGSNFTAADLADIAGVSTSTSGTQLEGFTGIKATKISSKTLSKVGEKLAIENSGTKYVIDAADFTIAKAAAVANATENFDQIAGENDFAKIVVVDLNSSSSAKLNTTGDINGMTDGAVVTITDQGTPAGTLSKSTTDGYIWKPAGEPALTIKGVDIASATQQGLLAATKDATVQQLLALGSGVSVNGVQVDGICIVTVKINENTTVQLTMNSSALAKDIATFSATTNLKDLATAKTEQIGDLKLSTEGGKVLLDKNGTIYEAKSGATLADAHALATNSSDKFVNVTIDIEGASTNKIDTIKGQLTDDQPKVVKDNANKYGSLTKHEDGTYDYQFADGSTISNINTGVNISALTALKTNADYEHLKALASATSTLTVGGKSVNFADSAIKLFGVEIANSTTAAAICNAKDENEMLVSELVDLIDASGGKELNSAGTLTHSGSSTWKSQDNKVQFTAKSNIKVDDLLKINGENAEWSAITDLTDDTTVTVDGTAITISELPSNLKASLQASTVKAYFAGASKGTFGAFRALIDDQETTLTAGTTTDGNYANNTLDLTIAQVKDDAKISALTGLTNSDTFATIAGLIATSSSATVGSFTIAHDGAVSITDGNISIELSASPQISAVSGLSKASAISDFAAVGITKVAGKDLTKIPGHVVVTAKDGSNYAIPNATSLENVAGFISTGSTDVTNKANELHAIKTTLLDSVNSNVFNASASGVNNGEFVAVGNDILLVKEDNILKLQLGDKKIGIDSSAVAPDTIGGIKSALEGENGVYQLSTLKAQHVTSIGEYTTADDSEDFKFTTASDAANIVFGSALLSDMKLINYSSFSGTAKGSTVKISSDTVELSTAGAVSGHSGAYSATEAAASGVIAVTLSGGSLADAVNEMRGAEDFKTAEKVYIAQASTGDDGHAYVVYTGASDDANDDVVIALSGLGSISAAEDTGSNPHVVTVTLTAAI